MSDAPKKDSDLLQSIDSRLAEIKEGVEETVELLTAIHQVLQSVTQGSHE